LTPRGFAAHTDRNFGENDMSGPQRMSGVLAPVVTPFKPTLAADAERLIGQCRWLLSQDCGLAVFGTNSEANSLSGDEKMLLLESLIGAGIDPKRMMPGTGACSIPEAAALSTRAVALGCAGVLMLPPFYYKDVGDTGLYRHFSEVIQRVGDSRLKIYLYHIPPVAQVPITLDLIEMLIADFPDIVVGVKDSSGEWANTKAMLDRQWPNFAVFSGNETTLLDNLRGGGAGCISATANVNPGAIARLCREWREPGAETRQAKLTDLRLAIAGFPMIPALKEIVARYSRDPAWATVRPPLVPLTAEERTALLAALAERNFEMSGLAPAYA
jgi:4-hydroxy-tetrahydrodipicolinate synthase